MVPGTYLARMGGGGAVLTAAVAALAYLVLGLASYALVRSPELLIAGIWPPVGVALAALVRTPRRQWGLVLAGIAVADAALLALVGTPPLALLAYVGADLVDPLLGAALIRRESRPRGLALQRSREVYLLTVYGAIVGPVAGTAVALLGAFASAAPGEFAPLPFAAAWWGSAALGTITIAPLVLTARRPRRRPRPMRIAELACLLTTLTLLTVAGFAFGSPLPRILALSVAAFPLLAWASIRFGPAGAAWIGAGLSLLAVAVTLRGYAPFASARLVPSHLAVVIIQCFYAFATFSALLLAATAAERRRAMQVQTLLAEAGAALASMAPLQARLERVVRLASDDLASAAVLWLASRPWVPAAVAQQAGTRPLSGVELAALATETPPRDPEQIGARSPCWLRVALGGEATATSGTLALRARRDRRYFDDAEVAAAEALAHRIALEHERDHLLAEAEHLYREAQEAVRVRDEFLSVASHELKTPLTPLAIRLQLLKRRVAAGLPIDEETVTRIQASLGRLAWLINDLLDVTRIQSGTMSIHTRRADLREVVDSAVASLPPHQAGRVHVQSPVQVPVRGDVPRLEQVVANLVDNALKYSEGAVEIEVSADAGEGHLQVRDHGIGIPPEQKDQLFERFYRARNATSTSYGGLGLGRYIVRDIVERHGGRVWAESEQGNGSTFHVALPLLPPEEMQAPATSAEADAEHPA